MLREPSFMILAAVAAEPLHGYGMIGAVRDLTGGRIRLRPGTLYTALDRLVAEGRVEIEGEEVVEGRRRRYYRITQAGLAVLRQEMDRLESNLSTARDQLARRTSSETA